MVPAPVRARSPGSEGLPPESHPEEELEEEKEEKEEGDFDEKKVRGV